jgi:hypothetical protein
MKTHCLILGLILAGASAFTTAADVGVSVRIGDPNFYGRIDIGQFPQPRVIYERPVIIQTVPVDIVREPIYLRVPPGHQKNWRRFCGRYRACGQPVYFVHNDWYQREYIPRYREEHRAYYEGRRDERRDERREERYDKKYDKHYDKHGRDRGNGKHGD